MIQSRLTLTFQHCCLNWASAPRLTVQQLTFLIAANYAKYSRDHSWLFELVWTAHASKEEDEKLANFHWAVVSFFLFLFSFLNALKFWLLLKRPSDSCASCLLYHSGHIPFLLFVCQHHHSLSVSNLQQPQRRLVVLLLCTLHQKHFFVCARASVNGVSCLWLLVPVSLSLCIMVHLPSLWGCLFSLLLPPSPSLSLSLSLPLPSSPSFSRSLSLSLWTQIQSVIWSPCNGRVIGTLPWLVGNLGELCTGAICNIFSKLNFFLFLSPSLFISPSLLSLPLQCLTQIGYFFSHPVSNLSWLFLPPPPPHLFIQCFLSLFLSFYFLSLPSLPP